MSGLDVSSWIASIGTMLAVFVALGGYWWSERQRRNDRKAVDLGHALQVGFKLTVLFADARHIHEHLFQNSTADDINDRSLLWRRLQPELSMEALTGPQLNAAEQNLLITLLEAEVLMQMTEVASRNQIIRKAMVEYRLKREDLQERTPPPVDKQDNFGVFEMHPKDVLSLSPWTSVLEGLVIEMRKLSILNVNATNELNDKYTTMMRKHFPGVKFLSAE